MSVYIGTRNKKSFPKVSITVVGWEEEFKQYEYDWENLKVYIEFNNNFYKCNFENEDKGIAVFLSSDIDDYKDYGDCDDDGYYIDKPLVYTNIMFTIQIRLDNPDNSTIEVSYKTQHSIKAKLSVM